MLRERALGIAYKGTYWLNWSELQSKRFWADSAANATILNGFCKRLKPLLPSAGRDFTQGNIHVIDDAINLNYGPDKIMPKILKLSAPGLTIHLTKLRYLCISNSTRPAECKLSHVTPLFQKTTPHQYQTTDLSVPSLPYPRFKKKFWLTSLLFVQ